MQIRRRNRRVPPPSDADTEEEEENPVPTGPSPSTSKRYWARARASSSGQGMPLDLPAAPPGVIPCTVGLWPDLSYMVQGGFRFLSLDGMLALPVTPPDATHVSFLIILMFDPPVHF